MRHRQQLLELVLAICRRDHLTQYSLARICGTSRPRAWNLLHGHISLFNSETLIDILSRLGVELELVVRRERPYQRWEVPGAVLRGRPPER